MKLCDKRVETAIQAWLKRIHGWKVFRAGATGYISRTLIVHCNTEDNVVKAAAKESGKNQT